ncbi:Clathrin coat assembly protein AP180 [Linum grandiflorum]
MPSKLRKAIGAVKDQTSISFAKISSAHTSASNLEVLILKATRHDDAPIDDRYVAEVLSLISSSKAYAGACALVISKRIGRTRNWIVALKSLLLVLRIFQDGDPYFPREVLHAMKRGARILNLSGFRDDSNSSPWDFTAFVRTFALYLDERLDCFITGKLQRRFTNRRRESGGDPRNRRFKPPAKMYFSDSLKPPVLLDRISFWQKLLDRAMATRPTGAAKSNRLVQICLYAVVQESFDLYRDISDGLALLLDSFFHLPYQSCATAFQACVKASKQFEELCSYYDFCKSIGVGRTSEYPSVQRISEELIETLQEFLKDQASFPAHGQSQPQLRIAGDKSIGEDAERQGMPHERQLSSLEDLMGLAGMCQESSEQLDYNQDMISAGDSSSSSSLPFEQGTATTTRTMSMKSNSIDLLSLDDWDFEDSSNGRVPENSNSGWEIVLAEITTQPNQLSETEIPNNFFDSGFEFGNSTLVPDHQYNPFLQDLDIPLPQAESQSTAATANGDEKSIVLVDDLFSSSAVVAPTFQSMPTFSIQSPEINHELGDWKIEQRTTSMDPIEDLFSAVRAPTFQASPTFAIPNADIIDSATTTATTGDEKALVLMDDVFSTSVAPTFQALPTFSVQSPERIETESSMGDDRAIVLAGDLFSAGTVAAAPTFQATPTFSAQSSGGGGGGGGGENSEDLFGPWPAAETKAEDREKLMREQQMWLENQNRIIAKNLC